MLVLYLYGVWKYLNQPIFDPNQPTQFSLKLFLKQYQIGFLHDCWKLETSEDNLLFEHHPRLSLLNQILRLERCWNLTKQCPDYTSTHEG